jgi:hypothetical protein
MLIRSDMSGMSVLSGLRASVETFPVWWAFPTSEYYARYDSPVAYGGFPCDSTPPPACTVFRGDAQVPALFRVRVSPSVPQELYTIHRRFPRAGASGASQVLRRLSSCMPRPEDSGGPAPPRQCGWARVAFGSVQTLGVRASHIEAVPALQGTRLPLRPTGYSVYASSILFVVCTTPTPPWTQDSIRVGG